MKEVNTVRFTKINEICINKGQDALLRNVDVSSLSPQKNLATAFNRVNYQVAIWKRSLVPNPTIHNPEKHGWQLLNGLLTPHWFDGEEMPHQLVDVEARVEADSDNEDIDESDSEIGLGVELMCDSDDE